LLKEILVSCLKLKEKKRKEKYFFEELFLGNKENLCLIGRGFINYKLKVQIALTAKAVMFDVYLNSI
jgi:hypothetical protein